MVEPESVDVSPAPDADTAAPVDAGTASAGTTVATALAGPDVAASNGDDGEGDGATPVEVETKLSTEVSREKPNSS
ncbi:MAG: hypothetical protein GY939_23710 [Actinomycetia bacterium]|nr:hypothetical protein [Actinomycetes bacterium]